jgi:hypothetical protein
MIKGNKNILRNTVERTVMQGKTTETNKVKNCRLYQQYFIHYFYIITVLFFHKTALVV